MSVSESIRLWLGWCPMVPSGKYGVAAVEEGNGSTRPQDIPFRTLDFKKMDYYRNQILVMNAFMTLAVLSLGGFFYLRTEEEFVINGPRSPLLVGATFGFGCAIYQALKYRKKLFKEGKLVIGHKWAMAHRHWLFCYLFYFVSFLGIWLILTYFLGEGGFFLAMGGLGCSYLAVQWAWYLDLVAQERGKNRTVHLEAQGMVQRGDYRVSGGWGKEMSAF